MIRDPQTPADWQAAADAAEQLLRMSAAQRFGLVEGGPAIDVARCEQLLATAGRKGFVPQAQAVAQRVGQLAKSSDRYIDQAEIGRRYQIGRTYLFEARKSRGFPAPAARRGKRLLWLRAAVEAWFSANDAAAAPKGADGRRVPPGRAARRRPRHGHPGPGG